MISRSAWLLALTLSACPSPAATDAGSDDTGSSNDTGSDDTGSDTGTERDAGLGEDAPPGDAGRSEDAGVGGIANIEEALACGTPLGVRGIALPGELQIYALDPAVFPDALCNDGSPAVIYYRPYRGEENRDRWVISLRGGGACNTPEDCAARWCACVPGATDPCPFTEVSTFFDLDNMSGGGRRGADVGGVMRRDGDPNPLEDYNHVQFMYCSSDSWVGNARAVPFTTPHPRTGEEVTYSIHFLGARILESDLAVLRQDGVPPLSYTLDGGAVPMPDLDEATSVVFVGDSAGGQGVISNLDQLRDRLLAAHVGASPPEVTGIIDAAVGPEWSRLDFTNTRGAASGLDTYGEAMDAIAALPANAGAFRDESCVAWHARDPATLSMCSDTMHVIRHHVTTPFFVRMALLDTLMSSIYEEEGLADPVLGPFTRTEIAPGIFVPVTFARVLLRELLAFPLLPSSAEEGASMSRAPGVFAPGCARHDTIHTDSEVYGVTIEDTASVPLHLFDVLDHWSAGTSPAALYTRDAMRRDTVCPP